MAVVVTNGADETTHADGGFIRVQEGHLVVQWDASHNGNVVAIYSPGSWQNAVITHD